MAMALHHVRPGRAIAEATRVLAPGGVLLILGYGRFGGLRDLPHEFRDVIAHRINSRGMQLWDPSTSKADPRNTWAETQTMAKEELPGYRFRRLPMWRHLIEWNKPTR
jgi:SAM-dependent methyltransferase